MDERTTPLAPSDLADSVDTAIEPVPDPEPVPVDASTEVAFVETPDPVEAEAPAPASVGDEPEQGPTVVEECEMVTEALRDLEESNKLEYADILSRIEESGRAIQDVGKAAAKSAEIVNRVSGEFRARVTGLSDLTSKFEKSSRILIIASASVMLIASIFFVAMGVRMTSRISQLDALLAITAKRAVELNTGLGAMGEVKTQVHALAAQQETLSQAQVLLDTRLEAIMKQSEATLKGVSHQTAKQVEISNKVLLHQVNGVNARLQSQEAALQGVGNEVRALQAGVGNVAQLKREVQALVTLQRERYLEQAQRQTAEAVRQNNVHYPRAGAGVGGTEGRR